jgi:hypothetical protein
MSNESWRHPFHQATDPDITTFCGLHLPPSPKKWQHLEQKLNWRFPEQYRRFVEHYGAASVEAKEKVWPRPRVGDVGPFWRAQFCFDVFGWDEECQDYTNLLLVYEKFKQANVGGPDLMPFMKEVSSADFWCFDRDGNIFHWFHDEPAAPQPVKEDFDTRLVEQTKELVANKDRVKQGE